MLVKKTEIAYCVYFDKGFLLKALAMHASLIRFDPEAKLWILALDEYTEKILKKLKLKGVTVVPLSEFEDKELLTVKDTRSMVEYYWTCSPSWPLYILKRNPRLKYITYLDGDLYFFSLAFEGASEIGTGSLLAVEHRFPKGQEVLARRNGRFNLAFNVFKNDKEGIECLERWRKQCLDWCYWKPEKGKMGDQGYLDEWPWRYKKLVISKNIGLDVAPWNVSQYRVSRSGDNILINNKRLICYHFHQFQILGRKAFNRVLGYTLSKNVVEYIYKPYEIEIEKQYEKIMTVDSKFEINFPVQTTKQVIKQNLAKYFGPLYWRLITVLHG